jgi:uncharacterized alkaline shock family protein YloU
MDQHHQENQHPDEQPVGQPTEKLSEEPTDQPTSKQLPEPNQPAEQPTEKLPEPDQPIGELPPPEPPNEVEPPPPEPADVAVPPPVLPPAEIPPQAAVRAQEQPPRETLITETVAEVLRNQPGIVAEQAKRSRLRTPLKHNGGSSNINIMTTTEGHFDVEVRLVVVYTPELSMPALANELRDRIRQRLSERAIEHPDKIDIVFADMVEPAATPE